ncbi:MAG: glutamine synthetase family protein [Gammaproteobacteria bacterium]|nr:glutamine synthetase family protein [Gammaproteobacteria bacterium]
MNEAMMNHQVARFFEDHPEIETLEVVLTDINGIFRGKWLPADSAGKVLDGKFKMPLTAVSPDIWGRDVPALCKQTGDGDGICQPVEHSIRVLPWLSRPTAQLFLQLNTEVGTPWEFDPRVVLKNVFEKYRERGLTPVCAPELEFFLFEEGRTGDGKPKIPATRVNGECQIGGQLYSTEVMQEMAGLMHEIRKTCDQMSVSLEGLLKELSAGQYELNLHHVDNPLQAADNAQLLKQVIKGVARKHGFIASFMAKPFGDRDGNGFHTHVSVLDREGRNIFDDGTEKGSDLMHNAIAGLAAVMPDSMLIFAPHLNSWRRLQLGVHGPLSPTWGYENRYVAMRIPNGDCAARRIEHRIAGADANPYLSLAVILAGILHGIDNRMQADPPTTTGPEKTRAVLPSSWDAALASFEDSEFIGQALGTVFQRAMSEIKRVEQHEFSAAVSALEYDSYLVLA